MARPQATGTRDRILDTATRLFHDQGVRAVGMQQLVDECGCGKNLLYREFESKDDLVAAHLARSQQEWTAGMDEATRPYADDPGAQLVAIVRAVVAQVNAADYTGCPFRSTHAAFRDPDHPGHELAVRHVKALRSRLLALAKRAQARDPRALTDRLMLIIDGVYVNGAVLGRRGAVSEAVAFAEEVVAAATLSTFQTPMTQRQET